MCRIFYGDVSEAQERNERKLSNIKKLSKYLLPIIVLPVLSILFYPWLTYCTSILGEVALAGYSFVNRNINVLILLFSLIPILCCIFVASSAKAGKVKEAKRKHWIFVIVFAATTLLCCVILVTMNNQLLLVYTNSRNVISIADVYVRQFAITTICLSSLLFIIGQVVLEKYSLLLTLIIGFGCLLVAYLAPNLMGVTIENFGTAIGFRFVGSLVTPFALIPVKAYSASFANAEASEAAEASTLIADATNGNDTDISK